MPTATRSETQENTGYAAYLSRLSKRRCVIRDRTIWSFAVASSELSLPARYLAVMLTNFADGGMVVWASINGAAARCNLSPRAVGGAFRELRASKWLVPLTPVEKAEHVAWRRSLAKCGSYVSIYHRLSFPDAEAYLRGSTDKDHNDVTCIE